MNPLRDHDYRPWMSGDGVPAMGLKPLPPDGWLEPGRDFAAQMAERERLLAEKFGEVCIIGPGTEAAQAEILARIIDDLGRCHPGLYEFTESSARCRIDGRKIDLAGDAPPIVTAARLVQEDLCLVSPREGAHVLTAAVLCFPSRWRLAEKIGLAVDAIHGPVPVYPEKLARPVDRFFEVLKPGRPVWRINWSLHATAELFQPGGERRLEDNRAAIMPEGWFIRMERQVLRRLECGDVLFSIRTHLRALGELAADSESRKQMAAALRSMPAATLAYKNLTGTLPALLEWLER
ncbi:MAG: DUF3445 domain-containing protein [Rhodospirillales bacterium]